jgi:hypothetical protein
MLAGLPAELSAKRKKKRKKPPPPAANIVEIPINVGFGPAVHLFTGPIQDDQLLHYGLKLSVAAVIDRATIQKNKKRIPARYRSYVNRVGEVRISKIYVPDTIFISPKTKNTQIFGVTFRPIGIGIPLINAGVRFKLGAGLLLTYAFIDSDTLLKDPMHFFRPGIDLKADFEIPFSAHFLMSFGWASHFYVPQKIGGPFLEVDGLSDTVWHIGQGYLLFHIRFPYRTRL